MIDRRKARHLVGETVRDIGILVFVFGPLDALYETGRASGIPLLAWLALGLSLMTLGIIMELSGSSE
jgi:hypothetical protein